MNDSNPRLIRIEANAMPYLVDTENWAKWERECWLSWARGITAWAVTSVKSFRKRGG